MPIRLSRVQVVALSTAAAVLFLALTAGAMYAGWAPPAGDLLAGPPLAIQVLVGGGGGLVLGALAGEACLRLGALEGLRRFVRQILADTRPRAVDAVYVSVAAGVSEEALFRFVLQSLLGLPGAALVFALVHVGWPNSRAKLAFTAFVFAMGLLLGLLYAWVGLVAAIAAHIVYDVVVMLRLMARLR